VQAPPRALAAVPDFDDNRLPADRHGSDNDDSAVVLPQRLARYRVALVLEEHTALPTLGLGRPAQIAAFFWQQLQDSPQEVMLAAYIDVRHQLIGWQRAFSGTLSRTAVEPRLILQAALLLNAAGVVIGHNHPSGEPAPSREDIAFTRVMDRAGEVVGVKLVDHLVIGNEGRWVSLRERGGW
jgi:DNA repair protein RadC